MAQIIRIKSGSMRRISLTILCLSAGIVATVCSWAACCLAPSASVGTRDIYYADQSRSRSLHSFRHIGYTYISRRNARPVSGSQSLMFDTLPTWSCYSNPEAYWSIGAEKACGWPFRATYMYAHEWYDTINEQPSLNSGMAVYQYGIPLSSQNWQLNAAVPYKPIWIGLIGNITIYSSTAYAVVALVVARRRYLRLRASQCTRCGYPNTGKPICPECGSVLTEPASATRYTSTSAASTSSPGRKPT